MSNTPARTPYAWLRVGTPTSGDPPASSGDVNRELQRIQQQQGGMFQPHLITANQSPYAVKSTDELILADATAGAVSIVLPPAARLDGLPLMVVRIDNVVANAVTLTGTINGVVNPMLATQFAGKIIRAGNGVWYSIPRLTAPDIGPGKFPAGNYEFPNDVKVDGKLTVDGLVTISPTGLKDSASDGGLSFDALFAYFGEYALGKGLKVSNTTGDAEFTNDVKVDGALEVDGGASVIGPSTFHDSIAIVTTSGTNGLGLSLNGAVANGINIMDSNAAAGTDQVIIFLRNGTQVGIITTSLTATTYTTSSDARLKRDLGVATSVDVLQNTVVHDFAWKLTDEQDRGVFAQEAEAVKPTAVHVGDEKHTWGVDYSKYVPDLLVGWQHTDARVTALEAQLAAVLARLAPDSPSQEPSA